MADDGDGCAGGGIAGAEHPPERGPDAEHVEVIGRRRDRAQQPRVGHAGGHVAEAVRRQALDAVQPLLQCPVVVGREHAPPAVGPAAVLAHRDANQAVLIGDALERQEQRRVEQGERRDRDRHADGEAADHPRGERTRAA